MNEISEITLLIPIVVQSNGGKQKPEMLDRSDVLAEIDKKISESSENLKKWLNLHIDGWSYQIGHPIIKTN